MKVGVAGCTGYTGFELLKLLEEHPDVTVTALTARNPALIKSDPRFFFLYGDDCDAKINTLEDVNFSTCDLVFFATPHGVCMKHAKNLLNQGITVIDLSADFRLRDRDLFETWYGIRHIASDLLDRAIYGLPELNRLDLCGAKLVAMPGCYPTSIITGVLPLIEERCLIKTLIADCKSGVSGAGRSASNSTAYGEVAENFRAYGVNGHRHLPEIKQEISQIIRRYEETELHGNVDIQFIPHLLPMFRGLYSSLYVETKENLSYEEISELYRRRYGTEYFVHVLPTGMLPETRFVQASNHLHLYINKLAESKYVNILVAEDNLLKGAAGQAVQVMNLIFGIAETVGLK